MEDGLTLDRSSMEKVVAEFIRLGHLGHAAAKAFNIPEGKKINSQVAVETMAEIGVYALSTLTKETAQSAILQGYAKWLTDVEATEALNAVIMDGPFFEEESIRAERL